MSRTPHDSALVNRTLQNDRLMRVMRGESVETPPIWLMRQAGRYLPEYREIRSQFKDFMSLCRSSDATTELACQPLRRFDLDAAIVFSDILTIADSLDLGLSFLPGRGPVIANPLTSPGDVAALPFSECLPKLEYVFTAVRSLRAALGNRLPIIGFTGSPWTQACYMIEGSSQAHFHQAKAFAYTHPVAMGELIERLSEISAEYLYQQYCAGADILFVIDTWGCVLSDTLFSMYSAEALTMIGAMLQKRGVQAPILFYGKSLTQKRIDGLKACPLLRGIGLDWTVDIGSLQKSNPGMVFQGNIDPILLHAGPEATQQHTFNLLNQVDIHQGYIASCGHGILPQTPLESVHALIDTVKNHANLTSQQ